MTSHPKRPGDPNQLAKSFIDIVTGQKPDRELFKLTHYPLGDSGSV
jgi:hypothetical protein